MAGGNFGGGNGTAENPYLVEDAADLNAVRNDEYAHYRQAKNISLAQYQNWEPLSGFCGTYDGQFYPITDLKIRFIPSGQFDRGHSSLFGSIGGYREVAPDEYVLYKPTLKNVVIYDADIVADEMYAEGTGGNASILFSSATGAHIHDCHVTGSAYAVYASGLGMETSDDTTLIERCSAIVNVRAGAFGSGFVLWGGTWGNGEPQFLNCYARGTLKAARELLTDTDMWSYLTGFSHHDYEWITKNCYSAMEIDGEHFREYGDRYSAYALNPFIQNKEVENCYADMDLVARTHQWNVNHTYDSSYDMPEVFVRGTDGNLYSTIRGQGNINYDDMNEWDGYPNVPPPDGWVFYGPNYAAQPVSGSNWAKYWTNPRNLLPNILRTTSEMKTKENYVGWDFENVWLYKPGQYPTLRRGSTGQLQAMPLTSITVVN